MGQAYHLRVTLFADRLKGAVVMAPMTKGSNLPYRQLCVEFGARVTVSEMTLARRLKQRRNSEFALIRRFPGEPCFGVQLAGTNPEEMAWAAALVESKGADFVDINFGCPIDYFTRKGLGAAVGRQPNRHAASGRSHEGRGHEDPCHRQDPSGLERRSRNYLQQARAVVDGGADALFVHGRTRNGRYRSAADWDAIGEIAAAVHVPVIGNGDVLVPARHRYVRRARGMRWCDGGARGVDQAVDLPRSDNGYWDITPKSASRSIAGTSALAKAHWGEDEHGLARVARS